MHLDFPLSPLEVVVLVSGGGTTLANLLAKIDGGALNARVKLVISSNPTARGIEIARCADVPTKVVDADAFADTTAFSETLFDLCRDADPHLVVMGGFLKLVEIPADYAGRVMNIHPSLIPAFCGKGYYGLRVHQAVLDAGATTTGCTVHFVDNQYDHGPIILQRAVAVAENDTPETLARRVFEAECEAYPEALRQFAAGRLSIVSSEGRDDP